MKLRTSCLWLLAFVVADEELAIELLNKQAVYVHPGHFYDFPNDGYLVVSLITPQEDFRRGVALVLTHLNS